MGKIKAIIFDWGGVLIEDPAPALFKYCAKALGVSEEQYVIAFDACINDFQTGTVTEQQFWMNMTNRLNARLGEAGRRSRVPIPKNTHRGARRDRRDKNIVNSACFAVSAVKNSLWTEAFAQAYRPRREMFSLASRLRKAGCKTAILSNTEKPVAELINKLKYDAFDVTVLSCLEGTAKPGRKIYDLTLDRLGIPARQALFIDDRQANIDGAKQAGLQTILFKGVDQLKKDIDRFSLNIV